MGAKHRLLNMDVNVQAMGVAALPITPRFSPTAHSVTDTPNRAAIRRAVASRRAVICRYDCLERQNRRRRALRCSAAEGRLRRIGHVKLNCLCDLLATQFGGETQGTVDSSGNTGGEKVVRVHHDSLIDWNRAEKRQ